MVDDTPAAPVSPTSSQSTCPGCEAKTVTWHNTLKGILYAIFCFPCGIYCCMKRREQRCSMCNCDVIKTRGEEEKLRSLGYPYRSYQTTTNGLPGASATAYRNMALSTSSTLERTHADSCYSYTSQTDLIPAVNLSKSAE